MGMLDLIPKAEYKVIYTDDMPIGFAGWCQYPFLPLFGTCTIKIRKNKKYDYGLFAHEMKHFEQYKRCFFHALLNKYSKKYRLKVEVEAYKEQLKYSNNKEKDIKLFTTFIVERYNLDISTYKVIELLK